LGIRLRSGRWLPFAFAGESVVDGRCPEQAEMPTHEAEIIDMRLLTLARIFRIHLHRV
jgi:hypothetical protein